MARPSNWKRNLGSNVVIGTLHGTAGVSKLEKAVRNRADKAPPEVLMKIAEDKVPPKKRIVRLGKRS